MRIAVSMGMNREIPTDQMDERKYKHRRRLWWTLYIIDRKISIMTGAPLSIKDHEIDIGLPQKHDLGFDNSALILHIKLAALEGQVIAGWSFLPRSGTC
jgi:proline utilization trans-activator